MQQSRSYAEVYHQRDSVHYRGDERRRHDSRVKAELLGDHRQGTAHELGYEYRDHHGQAYHKGDQYRDMVVVQYKAVKQHQLSEVDRGEGDAAQQRDSRLFEYYLEYILELDLTQAQRADDGNARL